MSPKKKFAGLIFIFAAFSAASTDLAAAEKIRVVATTNTIASLAREITGDLADIYYVASPKRDVHFIQPTPKDVLKVKKARVFIHGGLDLEAWRDPLLVAAGNESFLGNGKGSIDVSKGIGLLEIPASYSRAEGDIHLYGNPHYTTDPENAKIMAQNIAAGLAQLFPEHAEEFRKKAEAVAAKLDERIKEWDRRMEPFRGAAIVTYHNSWPYFAKHFGLEIIGQLEPKPGIPPTAKHLAALMHQMKEKKVRLIVKESFQEERTPKKISRETGAAVVTLAQSAGGMKDTDDYFSMMDYNVRAIEEALGKGGRRE